LIKTVELAERYDETEVVLPQASRSFLVVQSAAEYLRCGRFAISSAVVRRTEVKRLSSLEPTPTVLLSRLLVAFCSLNIVETAQTARRMFIELRNIIESASPDSATSEEVAARLSLSAVCIAIGKLESHFGSGEPSPLDEAESWIDRALTLGDSSGDSEYRVILESFSRAIRSVRRLSIWTIVRSHWPAGHIPEVASKWAAHRVSKGLPLAFPVQVVALNSAPAFGETSTFIALPTGAGKTLLAELFILHTLAQSPAGHVLLVEPSRALATEKAEDLRNALIWPGSSLRVCQMTGDTAFDTRGTFLSHHVAVITPEKLDILLRAEFFGEPPAGIVIDEFHTIRQSYRGVKLQLAVQRLHKARGMPSLYISAIVRAADLQAIAAWAYSEAPFSSEWRPTISRIGIVSLEAPQWVVEFNDGTFRRIAKPDPYDSRRRQLAWVYVARSFLAEDQFLHFSLVWRGFNGENVLLKLARTYMDVGPEMAPLNEKAHADFVTRVQRMLGPNDTLTQAARAGIAVHWGELPYSFRRLVENAIREHGVGLVISTATLAEGVNLPIKTVFLPKLTTRRGDMDKGQFLNVAGRAGRPFTQAEGQLVIATNESGPVRDQTTRDKGEEFANATSEDVPALVTAVIGPSGVYSELKAQGRISPRELYPRPRYGATPTGLRMGYAQQPDPLIDFLAESENLTSALLASVKEGLLTRISSGADLERVLFFGPETRAERTRVFEYLDFIESRTVASGVVELAGDGLGVTEWGNTVYLTGLGPESCSLLRSKIEPYNEEYRATSFDGPQAWEGDELQLRFINSMLELLSIPREVGRVVPGGLSSFDKRLLASWIRGAPLASELSRAHVTGTDYLGRLSRVESNLSVYGSWIFYASHLISKFEDPHGNLGTSLFDLAQAALYGHPDPGVIRLMQRDTRHLLLRDDVVALFHSIGPHEFRRLLEEVVDPKTILAILDGTGTRTRFAEEDFADALARLTGPGRSV
jgi:hypothetical protein